MLPFRLKQSTVFVLSYTLLCLFVWAQKPQQQLAFEIHPDESEAWEMENGIRMSVETEKPLAIFSLHVPVPEGEAEIQGLHFLSLMQNKLGLESTDLEQLEYIQHRDGDAGRTIRFLQNHQGVPVYNSEITLNIAPNGIGTTILNGWKYDLPPINPVPSLALSTARQMALSHLGATVPFGHEAAQLVVWPYETPRLAWRITVEPQSPTGFWEVLVDAHDGTIFKTVDRAAYAGPSETDFTQPGPWALPYLPPPPGTGSIFNPDPLSTAGVNYGGNYTDNNDNSNAQLQAEVQTVPLVDVTFSGGNYQLISSFAEIQDFENPSRGLFAQASPNFIFNRQQAGFEAVNTFYHIDGSMRYINDTLGCNIMPYQYSTGVRFDPHGLNGADNSHYLGGSGRISFGEGGVDDAEDADVVLHELGHGIHDWVTGGGLSQVNGLSEGCGDYWASSYSRAQGHWTSSDPQYFWVFDWDGHNPFWGGRITNYGASYPGGLVGQIHTDGQIWATCLMQIWDQIGRTKTDKAFLEGLGLTNGSSSQQDAALAVRQAAINMNYTTTEVIIIHNIFAGCGYNMGTLPTLPIETIDFTGTRLDLNQIKLDWEVEAETGGTEYVIERKETDAETFSDVGIVAVENGANKSHYQFIDLQAPTGKVWYRLRQETPDGGVLFSNAIEVSGLKGNGNGMVLFPNPAQDQLSILLGSEEVEGEEVWVRIFDLSGRLVLEEYFGSMGGESALRISSVSQLEPGSYQVKVSGKTWSQQGNFVKL